MTTAAPAEVAGLGIDGKTLRAWLADMLLIRTFEETADNLALRGKVPGGMHPAIGQEAAAVGIASALQPADILAATHRSHHHALAKSAPPHLVMAELYGKATGLNGGRSGSMHLADFDLGLWGCNGIVGAGLGIAMGGALVPACWATDASLSEFSVTVALTPDGSGEFVNLAAIWRLPLIAVCENNLYAVETPSAAVTGGASVAGRAAGFGLPSVQVDGQDVVAVHTAVTQAAERGRAGEGPTFLEVLTYRYKGHDSGQVVRYRTEEEVESWRSSRDPIEQFSARLVAAGQLTTEQLTDLAETARRTVEEAVRFAEEAPAPNPSTAAANVSAWTDPRGYAS